jgi:hypothetical protein
MGWMFKRENGRNEPFSACNTDQFLVTIVLYSLMIWIECSERIHARLGILSLLAIHTSFSDHAIHALGYSTVPDSFGVFACKV